MSDDDDDRVPVKLTEVTCDEKGVQIRGTIPYDQAVRLGLTQGAADVSGFSLVNRWAAFTDDELKLIIEAFTFTAVGSDMPADDLNEEVEAELERRKT